jgi:anthranilate phosphoribosyltransferase
VSGGDKPSVPVALKLVARGQKLSREECFETFKHLFESEGVELAAAGLLAALAARGESAEELAGVVDLLLSMAQTVPIDEGLRSRCVDVCGTGGDEAGTFNISTVAAFIAAAAGVPVAKHGGRSVSSRCGSADVLVELGAQIEMSPESAARALEATGFAFLFAPHYHPAMKRVAPLRRSLGIRTIFNLAGPLSNPARVKRQIVGVDRPARVPVVAKALALRGLVHGLVFSHSSGLDELLPAGENVVAEIHGDDVTIKTVTASDFGLREVEMGALAGGDAAMNAVILRDILSGEESPRTEVVLMNAAAAVYVAGVARTPEEATVRVRESVKSGEALETLERFLLLSRSEERAG